jgi:hypothetical protein
MDSHRDKRQVQTHPWSFRREHRVSERLMVPYPARLWGRDSEGRSFKEDTVLDDLSVGGLHLRLTRDIPQGSDVSVAARLSAAPVGQGPTLRLVARGIIRRTKLLPDGTWGVAVEFTRRRVL